MSILGCTKKLANFNPLSTAVRNLTNKSCIFRKCGRLHYLRLYPTVIVQSDGSTYTVYYHEPRHIIRLPFDLSPLSEEDKKKMLQRRFPMKKVEMKKEVKNNYNADIYLKYIRGKK